MRKRNHTGNVNAVAEQDEPGLDLSSLIDVSFLLLIFFLVTSTLEPRDADLGMTIPTTDSDKIIPIQTDEVPTVEIASDGSILFSRELVEAAGDERHLATLKSRLATYVKMTKVFNQEAIVHLKSDDSVRGQRFTDVINCLAAVGIENVALDKSEWGPGE